MGQCRAKDQRRDGEQHAEARRLSRRLGIQRREHLIRASTTESYRPSSPRAERGFFCPVNRRRSRRSRPHRSPHLRRTSRSGARWLHTGGIFAGLSETTAALTIEACQAAKKHGLTVSYDLNYRPSLWQERGGFAGAQALNRQLAPFIDVMIGVLADAPPAAAAPVPGSTDIFSAEDAALRPAIEGLVREFPNLTTIAATLRRVHTASVNDWGALCWHKGSCFRSRNYPRFDILDRIGAGDSFVAGLIYGLLEENDPQAAIDLGAAHGALAMTTPGDTSMATLPEVRALASQASAAVQR